MARMFSPFGDQIEDKLVNLVAFVSYCKRI